MRGLHTHTARFLTVSPKIFYRSITLVLLAGFFLASGFYSADASTTSVSSPSVQTKSLSTSVLPIIHPVNDYNSALLSVAMTNLFQGEKNEVLLSEKDVGLYQTIFKAQAKQDWRTADAALKALNDRRLVGHVLAQRYLHPTAYRTTYDELKNWLAQYGDLPEARKIHSLALKKQTKVHKVAVQEPTLGQIIKSGLPAAATMASTDIPAWNEGLTAWRLKDYNKALVAFKQVAEVKTATPWEQAAGAYWAARCLTRLHHPEQVSLWLNRAAKHSRTFYGLMALQQLGEAVSLNWDAPELNREHLRALAKIPGGYRAIALLQVGQNNLAELELRRLQSGGDSVVEEGLVALSLSANLANLALRVGTAFSTDSGKLYDAALYPVPQWKPENGYRIDRALVFAVMRQESRFDPLAKSKAGAIGLMQLMPTTASFVAGKRYEDKNLDELAEPVTNVTLAQKYIEHLLQNSDLEQNLFYVLAAYNSGPTQVSRWKKDMGTMNDPLLFLEMIPVSETRDFAERVLTNYWIYQIQLGHPVDGLEKLVAGNWPMYQNRPADDVVHVADNSPATTLRP